MLAEILCVPSFKIMECQGDEESKANWFLEEGNWVGDKEHLLLNSVWQVTDSPNQHSLQSMERIDR